MLKILREEFVRMSMDFKLYVTILLIIIIYLARGRYEFWQAIFLVLGDNDELYFAAPTLLGLISVASFAGDMHSGYYRPLCMRYGVSKYVYAKAIYIMLAPFCIALLCHVIAFLAMAIGGVPLYSDSTEYDIITNSRYLGWALECGTWWPYMLGGAICLGAGSCLLISIAAYASVYIPSRMFIWALPVILNLFCMILASQLRVPNYLNINMLIRGRVAGLEPCPTLYILALLVLPTLLIMWAFVRAAKRRVLNA